MQHVKTAPRGARLALLVLSLALATGAVLFVRLHLGRAVAAPRTARGHVASPSSAPGGARAGANP